MGKIKEQLYYYAELAQELLDSGVNINELDDEMRMQIPPYEYKLYIENKDVIMDMLGEVYDMDDTNNMDESIKMPTLSNFINESYLINRNVNILNKTHRTNMLNEMELSTMVYSIAGVIALSAGTIAFGNDIKNDVINTIDNAKSFIKKTFNKSQYDKDMINSIAEKLSKEPEIIEFFQQPVKKQVNMRKILDTLENKLSYEERNYLHNVTKSLVQSKILKVPHNSEVKGWTDLKGTRLNKLPDNL